MKKLLTLLFLLTGGINTFAQTANSLLESQAMMKDTIPSNYLFVDSTGNDGLYRIYVASWNSFKIKPMQIKWLVDSLYLTNAKLSYKLNIQDTLNRWKPIGWFPDYSEVKNKPNLSEYYLANNPNHYINDTTGLSNRINNKLNIIDTTGKWKNINWNESWTSLKDKPVFDPIAFSGNYNDLKQLPNIPNAQINVDWNSNSGLTQILNKPDLGIYYLTSNPDGYIKANQVIASIGYSPLKKEDTLNLSNRINTKLAISDTSNKWKPINWFPTLGELNTILQSTYYPRLSNPEGYLKSYTETDPLFDTKLASKSTTNLSEGTNLYYSNIRARSAISLTTTGTGAASYNNSTGVLNIPTPAIISYTYTNPVRPINGTSYQISTIKEAFVTYSLVHTVALTLLLTSGSSMVYLEISPNNTTWTTISSAGYTESLGVGVSVNKSVTNNVQGFVPANYYCRLRTVISGGGTIAFSNSQERY